MPIHIPSMPVSLIYCCRLDPKFSRQESISQIIFFIVNYLLFREFLQMWLPAAAAMNLSMMPPEWNHTALIAGNVNSRENTLPPAAAGECSCCLSEQQLPWVCSWFHSHCLSLVSTSAEQKHCMEAASLSKKIIRDKTAGKTTNVEHNTHKYKE